MLHWFSIAGLRDRGAPVTVPLVFKPEPLKQDYQRMNVIGRLKSGVSIRQAQANIDMAVARATHSYANGTKGLERLGGAH